MDEYLQGYEKIAGLRVIVGQMIDFSDVWKMYGKFVVDRVIGVSSDLCVRE